MLLLAMLLSAAGLVAAFAAGNGRLSAPQQRVGDWGRAERCPQLPCPAPDAEKS